MKRQGKQDRLCVSRTNKSVCVEQGLHGGVGGGGGGGAGKAGEKDPLFENSVCVCVCRCACNRVPVNRTKKGIKSEGWFFG